jgi:hypothetical protein
MRKKGNNPGSWGILYGTGMFHRKSSFAVALALAGLLLFITAATVVGHNHDGADSAACQVCHIAHSPVVQTAVQAAIAQPEFTSALALPAPYISFSDPILSSEASRAPPSA